MMASDRLAKIIVFTLSFIAIVFLFWLIYFKPQPVMENGYPSWATHLNSLNALLNFCAAVCLSFGYYHIRQKNILIHRRFMLAAFAFSSAFLVSYILYHHYHGDTKFQGVGWIRPVYFFILISHILLSIVALPMVLLSLYFALKSKIDSHRKLARWTLPIWLYVSVTGVLVYFFIVLAS